MPCRFNNLNVRICSEVVWDIRPRQNPFQGILCVLACRSHIIKKAVPSVKKDMPCIYRPGVHACLDAVYPERLFPPGSGCYNNAVGLNRLIKRGLQIQLVFSVNSPVDFSLACLDYSFSITPKIYIINSKQSYHKNLLLARVSISVTPPI